MHRHNVILKARLAGVARVPAAATEHGVATPSDPSPGPAASALAAPAHDMSAFRSLLQELTELAQKLKERQSLAFGEVAQMSVELAAAIAERLVGEAIAADRQRLDRIVLGALERMPSARTIVVRGHAADLALLERLMDEHLDLGACREILTLRPDENRARGQLSVEADDWFVEWDTPRSLAEMRAALLDETFTDE